MRIDLNQFKPLIEKGLITSRPHPTLPLLIHHYTKTCQYGNVWNEFTILCRGLITDLDGNVICRPFPKFFNIEEHEHRDSKLPKINWNQDYYITEKIDGALAILFPTDNGYAVTTKAGFDGQGTKDATALWKEKHSHFEPLSGKTYLFELVYPENRIIVDYGDTRDLILLDIIDNEEGYGATKPVIEKEAARIGCPSVSYYNNIDDGKNNKINREGIVLRFNDGLRVKIKLEEYKRLHKILAGLSSRSIWECLSKGSDVNLEQIPDEWYEWVDRTRADLLNKFKEIEDNAKNLFNKIQSELGDASRNDYAKAFLNTNISGILFVMLDKQSPSDIIWKMIYPEAEEMRKSLNA